MERKGMACWFGSLKSGHGVISTESKALSNLPYSFKTRFDNETGTNPEELIGAAHAGCFSMALSAELEKKGITADKIKTEASVTLDKNKDGFYIPAIHLTVNVTSSMDKALFKEATEIAKKNCPISKLLNTSISMEAHLKE